MNKLVEAENKNREMISDQARREAENIANAAKQDAGYEKMMKFKKGHYYVDGEEVPLKSQYTAHCIAWTKCWIKFKNGGVEERRVYPMIKNVPPPDRADLDEFDSKDWELGLDGRPKDPWVLQFLLPLENESGDLTIFVTSSFGGKRAVADVCAAWGRKAAKDPNCGQPIVRIGEVMMPTKRFGDVPRPNFEIVGWESPELRPAIREVNAANIKQDDMNDEIPF